MGNGVTKVPSPVTAKERLGFATVVTPTDMRLYILALQTGRFDLDHRCIEVFAK